MQTIKNRFERPLMFAYWGRRGALCRHALNLAETVAKLEASGTTVSISNSNEIFEDFARFGDLVFPVETFFSPIGALTHVIQLVKLQRRLAARFESDGTRAFVSLMSHVWSPLMVPVIRRAGIRHVVVVHDVDAHPGDYPSFVNTWLLREARAADRVVALSRAVAQQLVSATKIPEEKIRVLFLPDIAYGRAASIRSQASDVLRVLFMGRILAYKGLELFVGAIELLRQKGINVHAGVFGAGDLGEYADRLSALGAEVENHWIDDRNFNSILARHDVVVLSYTSATQSGVISTAFGAGLPVVITPVGGLVEQVDPEVTGIVASAVSVEALAEAIRRLAEDRLLLERLRRGVVATAQSRSMRRFFDAIATIALER
jgi:glycosyltransferase involved in cell wall biosynthesis